jgi:hypothetical protein
VVGQLVENECHLRVDARTGFVDDARVVLFVLREVVCVVLSLRVYLVDAEAL